MGTGSSRAAPTREPTPPWMNNITPPADPGCWLDTKEHHSDGWTVKSPNIISRTRAGAFHTDAARWKEGFNSGKHAFRVNWPAALHGVLGTVGVGTEDAPLYHQTKISLVGNDYKTWGVDLRLKKTMHRATKGQLYYPEDRRTFPDTFRMYLDMDAGTLSFSADSAGGVIPEYYGVAHKTLPVGKEKVYPMVAACLRVDITMEYLGTCSDPPPGAVGVAPSAPPPGPSQPVAQPPPPPPQEEKKVPPPVAEEAKAAEAEPEKPPEYSEQDPAKDAPPPAFYANPEQDAGAAPQ